MKKYLSSLILIAMVFSLVFPVCASAKCINASIELLNRNVLPVDTLIFIDVMTMGAEIDWDQFAEEPLYLEAGEARVRLLPYEELWTKRIFRNQIIVFKPEEVLEPDTRYTLNLVVPARHKVHGNANTQGEYRDDIIVESFSFKTSKSVADKPADLIEGLYTYKYESIAFGCGPSDYHFFKAEAPLESPLYMVRIRRPGDSEFETLILKTKADRNKKAIIVGHGMCGGNYCFKQPGEYEISAAPMNYAGDIGEFSETMVFVAGEAEILDVSETGRKGH